jgi:hypothetical protein
LNSKESFDERTATSSSVRLSGARRVKEIADRLDIYDYRIDPGNSDRGNLVRECGASTSLTRFFAEFCVAPMVALSDHITLCRPARLDLSVRRHPSRREISNSSPGFLGS